MTIAIYIDREKCISCDACVVACKLEHSLAPEPMLPPIAEPIGPQLIHIHQVGPEVREDEIYQYFQPIACMHCLDAPCIKACPRSALYKDDETGITLIDQDKCIGCKFCLWVCPYGSPQFYNSKMYLCDLCIHRIGQKRPKGRRTACEAACPARAIHVGTTEEISAFIGQQSAERAGKGKSRPL